MLIFKDTLLRLRRALQRDFIVCALILMTLAGGLTCSESLNRFDALYFDLGRYLSFKKPPSDIVIIAIDEHSLAQLGRWPWSRSVHAELIHQVSQDKPRVIGLDILFSEPDHLHKNADVDLASAISMAKNVVLPTFFEVPFLGAAIKQSMPLKPLAIAAAGLGRIHVPLDNDGLARGIYLQESLVNLKPTAFSKLQQAQPSSLSGDIVVDKQPATTILNGFSQTHSSFNIQKNTVKNSTFAAAILHVAKNLPEQHHFENTMFDAAGGISQHQVSIQRKAYRLLNFSGPPGHFQRISYVDVLLGNYPKGFFKHKIVLVGATAVGLGDVLPTTVSAMSQPMPGVEFHANVIEATRTHALIKPLPKSIVTICSILLSMLPVFWLRKLSPLKSLLGIGLYFIIIIILSLLLAHVYQWWFAPASLLATVLLAYPIWSWRKLESAQQYLDHELSMLQAEIADIGENAQLQISHVSEDAMQSRIMQVQRTAEKLRSLHHERNDTLAFISHDLRSPLGSAMMILEEVKDNKYVARASAMLNRANNMAEEFLQVSRAENVQKKDFQAVELLGLIQQVQDDVYAQAKHKSIHIKLTLIANEEVDSSFSELWVLGDFGLLQRAFANVLLNAIKYSPEASIVFINVLKNHHGATVSITDVGAGIPADKLSRLFKRFSRAEGTHQSADGTGLGLYFVQTVLVKHGGHVNVVSKEVNHSDELINQNDDKNNSFTTVSLTLPCIYIAGITDT